MKLYAAIDLHSNNSVLVVLDEQDTVVAQRKLPNELDAVLGALAPWQEAVQGVAVESTYNWYWLVDGLQDAGYRVHLVNTAAVPQYDGLKHGDDRSDAWLLAHLLRLGLLPEGYIYPRQQRSTRDLLRRRQLLVHQAVQLMLSIQSAFARATGRRLSANGVRQLKVADVEQTFPDPTERFSLLVQLRAWNSLQRQITQVEHWIASSVEDKGALSLLRTTPGIGETLGLTILLETGDIGRFASPGDYASYCRMVESVRMSKGKRKGTGNAKCGNRYLCWAYIEAANFAIRFDPRIRRWYDRKRSRKHRVVALKAVAHKLARANYFVLRDRVPFEVERAFA